ncbi:hypothetical protein CEXT_662871 [Caerostris extrusa]|uniref:Uncharacterized protein n=1 Tax=Caerostris extrusa TaxID=172846 RepID=A0AAV4NX98_CAEEX|nr:hypothetical protein CEXT_662871 [Caerostris extrusa]
MHPALKIHSQKWKITMYVSSTETLITTSSASVNFPAPFPEQLPLCRSSDEWWLFQSLSCSKRGGRASTPTLSKRVVKRIICKHPSPSGRSRELG